MKLQEANDSIKLECALRELGFIEIDWIVYGHAGIYYVYPVSYQIESTIEDEIIGFQLNTECEKGLHLGSPLLQTAKTAIEYAMDNHYLI